MSISQDPGVTDFAPELGAFCLAMGGLSLNLMNKLSGNLCDIDKFIANKDWAFLKKAGDNFKHYMRFLRVMILSLLFMAPVTLIVWMATLFHIKRENNESYVLPVSVLTLGLFVIFMVLGVFYIAWHFYRPSVLTLVFVLLGISSLLIYEICGNFLDVDERSFFGISAIFLGFNCLFLMVIIFLNSGTNTVNFDQIANDKLKEKLEIDIIKDDEDFSVQMAKCEENPNYMVTLDEIRQFFTLSIDQSALLRGGIIKSYSMLSAKAKTTLNVILYLFSVGILIAYAFIIYNTTPEYKLGFITFIATVTTDCFIYFFFYIGLTHSVLQLCLLAVAFRVCLFGFGGTYWYYGYCLLYGLLGLLVAWNIASKHFPLIEALAQQALQEDTPAEGEERYWQDLMKTPEFLLLFASIGFGIITICLIVWEPDGVPLPSLVSDSGKEFKFWCMALIAYGCVIFCYLLFAIIRIYIRRRQNISERINIYFFTTLVDVFWIHLLLEYLVIIIAGVITYGITTNNLFLICPCLLPLLPLLIIYVLFYYAANDYRVLKDIEAENLKRKYLRKVKDKERDQLENYKAQQKKDEDENEDDEEQAPLGRRSSKNMKAMKRKSQLKPPENLIMPLPLAPPPIKEETPAQSEQDRPEDKVEEEKKANSEKTAEPIVLGGTNLSPEQPTTVQPSDRKLQALSPITRTRFEQVGGARKLNEMERAALDLEESEELPDWRTTHSFVGAFCEGKLHTNDYKVLLGLLALVVVIIINSIIMQAAYDFLGAWHGVTLGVIIFDSLLIVCPFFKFLLTDLPFGCAQLASIALGIIIHVVYGIINFGAHEKGDFQQHFGTEAWFYIYTYFVPSAICLIAGLYKLQKLKWKISVFTIVLTVIFLGLIIVFTIQLWYLYGVKRGIITLAVNIAALYLSILFYFHAGNNYVTPFPFKIINVSLVILGCCAVMISSWAVDGFAPFVGFSVTFGLIAGGCLLFFLFEVLYLIRTFDSMPTFFSPYVFPVFSFNVTRNTSIQSEFYVIGLYASLAAAFVYSVILAIYMRPMFYGVAVTSLVIVLTVFLTLYLITFTPIKLQEASENITPIILKKSWMEAKKRFIEHSNAPSLSELWSFEEYHAEYNKVYSSIVSVNDQKAFDELFEIEFKRNEAFMDEVHLMVDFMLFAIIAANNEKAAVQNKTLNFLKKKAAPLKVAGIDIKYKGFKDANVRHAIIMKQVGRLSPEKRVKYDELLAEYEKELDLVKQKTIQKEKEAEKAEKERQESIDKKQKEAKEKKEKFKVNPNMTVDEMPDCEERYQKIMEEYRANKKLFEDKHFPASEVSLGKNVVPRCAGWRRPEGLNIMEGIISAQDVHQGKLGDCYFLSAITVMGEEFIKKCIYHFEDGHESGAICVKFPKSGDLEEQVVIIDTNFPVQEKDEKGLQDWAFAKSEDEKEFWPNVLEKAYAKLYGSYQNIEAGKVQFALADLTGGVPEQIKLDTVENNLDPFWAKIMAFHKAGYLMGAGSPENEIGDKAISDNCIVQGHAYAVLEVEEFEGERLLKLRNPHGEGGAEWIGDWSDESPKWTEAAKAALKYENKPDGQFWINLGDFVSEFKFLYVCRLLKNNDKWVSQEEEGRWEGETAQGLPMEGNNPKLQLNPHYTLTINTPSSIFVKLTQHEAVNMFQGKQSIYFVVANNNGERIIKPSRETTVCTTGPAAYITVTADAELDTSAYSFPLSLTIMVATKKGGSEGNGTFTLTVYSTDKSMNLDPMAN